MHTRCRGAEGISVCSVNDRHYLTLLPPAVSRKHRPVLTSNPLALKGGHNQPLIVSTYHGQHLAAHAAPGPRGGSQRLLFRVAPDGQGAPAPPRSRCSSRSTRPTTSEEVRALRASAFHQTRICATPCPDATGHWLLQSTPRPGRQASGRLRPVRHRPASAVLHHLAPSAAQRLRLRRTSSRLNARHSSSRPSMAASFRPHAAARRAAHVVRLRLESRTSWTRFNTRAHRHLPSVRARTSRHRSTMNDVTPNTAAAAAAAAAAARAARYLQHTTVSRPSSALSPVTVTVVGWAPAASSPTRHGTSGPRLRLTSLAPARRYRTSSCSVSRCRRPSSAWGAARRRRHVQAAHGQATGAESHGGAGLATVPFRCRHGRI